MPKQYAYSMGAANGDRMDLVAAAEKSGIAKRLEKAGLKYLALSPRWASSIKSTKDGEVRTAHKVIFWLNPYEQQIHNFGWFTVEDLDAWIKGEGPIPMKKKTA